MEIDIVEKWKSAFFNIVEQPDIASILKEASLQEKLTDWTKTLTTACVKTCEALGWSASAKGHQYELLPVKRNEYLALDAMAFPDSHKKWRFPVAVFELENSLDNDQIAYSLWKLLCIRADLRFVFCYRKSSTEGAQLIKLLQTEVVYAMGLTGRIHLAGDTLVVIGSRGDAATFPYRFFKWWKLDKNTGVFSSF